MRGINPIEFYVLYATHLRMIPRPRIVGLALIFLVFATILIHGRDSVRERFRGNTAAKEPNSKSQGQGSEEKVAQQPPSLPLASACPDHLDWLRELADSPDLTFPLKYARRDIIVRPIAGLERASVTKLDGDLLPDLQEISSPEACELEEENRLPPFYVHVPDFSNLVHASHIIFGAATTLERLDKSIPFFQRWLAHSGARLFVIVAGKEDAAPDQEAMDSLQGRMRDLGMIVTLVKPLRSTDTGIERVFSLVRVLNQNRDETTKWFGIIDDDTFFTSLSTLVSRLGEFDHQKRWYLGAVSEDWWTVVQYGWVAMGE